MSLVPTAIAPSTTPRFLLPRYGAIWRRPRIAPNASGARRSYASGTKPGKPIVLEKPAKFNPPSHGSRLPKRSTAQRHYGGDLDAVEQAAQNVKHYPGMMAPKGTWSHWIWHSRLLHTIITMGTLIGLAMYTFVENFRRTSPFADMIPSGSAFLSHPFSSLSLLFQAVRLTEEHRGMQVAEKRQRRVDDVVKRARYRKAHGLESQGYGGWTAKTEDEDEEEQSPGTVVTAAVADVAPVVAAPAEVEVTEQPQAQKQKRKVYFGIW